MQPTPRAFLSALFSSILSLPLYGTGRTGLPSVLPKSKPQVSMLEKHEASSRWLQRVRLRPEDVALWGTFQELRMSPQWKWLLQETVSSPSPGMCKRRRAASCKDVGVALPLRRVDIEHKHSAPFLLGKWACCYRTEAK